MMTKPGYQWTLSIPQHKELGPGLLRKLISQAGLTIQVNAFVIKAAEPVLVDTGMGIESDEFMKALESIIDPLDLKWVWLTHDDSEAFFSADCFGAIIPSPALNAGDVSEGDLAQGMTGWASADSPWVHLADPGKFSQALNRIRQIAPKMIFSAHLPPMRGKTEQLLELLSKVPASPPFITPNQTALEQILAQMKGR
jgi:hypothetical protein